MIRALTFLIFLNGCATANPTPEHAMFAKLVEASTPYKVGAPPVPNLVITPSSEFTAYTQNGTVYVTKVMVETIGVTDELAFVEGHEIAHIVLLHGPTRPAVEREADVIGRCIMAHAGYDHTAALRFFERVDFPTDEWAARMDFIETVDIGEYCQAA